MEKNIQRKIVLTRPTTIPDEERMVQIWGLHGFIYPQYVERRARGKCHPTNWNALGAFDQTTRVKRVAIFSNKMNRVQH